MVLDKAVATSTSLLALALAGLAGCYTVAFDEDRPDVYYCVDNSDCLATQACQQFRCVSDDGPKLRLTLPEPLTLVKTSELTVDFSPTDFVISDSNHKTEGEGKVRITIDSGVIEQTVVTKGALVDISALEGGAHRVEIQAVYGDGTPYPNPSSYDYTAFFVEGDNPARPQVAIVHPPPGYLHLKGEPLTLEVAVRNFQFVDGGNDCKVPSDCDPFDSSGPECIPNCEGSPTGHAHVYLLDDYPDCLKHTPIGCNGDYVLSMRTNTNASGTSVTDVVEGKFFDTVGPVQLTVSLQYNDHDPYPAKSFVIYDTIEVHVTE